MNIGINIKKRREEMRITQMELADKVGTTQVMINHIEHGRKLPSLPLFYDIACALHCTMDELAAEKAV